VWNFLRSSWQRRIKFRHKFPREAKCACILIYDLFVLLIADTEIYTEFSPYIRHHIVIEQANVREYFSRKLVCDQQSQTMGWNSLLENRKFGLIIDILCDGTANFPILLTRIVCNYYFTVCCGGGWEAEIWLPIIIISNLHASLYPKFITPSININLLPFRIRAESELKQELET
jgi:hypothetical protein